MKNQAEKKGMVYDSSKKRYIKYLLHKHGG